MGSETETTNKELRERKRDIVREREETPFGAPLNTVVAPALR